MKFLALLCLLLTTQTHASFLFHYGLNYSSEKDNTSGDSYDKSRTFHKIFLGASVNNARTLFFGWNINSWSSSLKKKTEQDSYSLTEMGPKVTWFFNEERNWYLAGEWNPYARGEREKSSVKSDISGMSYAFGLGYRFKLSRLIGLGASLHYHTLSIAEEKIAGSESDVSHSVTNLMPMIELAIITK